VILGHERLLWQQTMQGHAETGVGTKNRVVLHAVKMAFWQVYSVIHFKSCIYQNCVFWGFVLSQQLSVPNEITQVSFIANSSWSCQGCRLRKFLRCALRS